MINEENLAKNEEEEKQKLRYEGFKEGVIYSRKLARLNSLLGLIKSIEFKICPPLTTKEIYPAKDYDKENLDWVFIGRNELVEYLTEIKQKYPEHNFKIFEDSIDEIDNIHEKLSEIVAYSELESKAESPQT